MEDDAAFTFICSSICFFSSAVIFFFLTGGPIIGGDVVPVGCFAIGATGVRPLAGGGGGAGGKAGVAISGGGESVGGFGGGGTFAIVAICAAFTIAPRLDGADCADVDSSADDFPPCGPGSEVPSPTAVSTAA